MGALRGGIVHLAEGGASIINLSLGEAGKPLSARWRGTFVHNRIAPHAANTAYVIAAGNDGIAQPHDVEWSGAFDTSSIMVGSVRPDGTILPFSNTPGEACLLDNGVCREEVRLKRRFTVAPGEMILVDDGHGGVIRRSSSTR